MPFTGPTRTATVADRWLLTHAEWNGSNETGVRDLTDIDETTGRPHFDLIQHGWHSVERAEGVIVHGLLKGWSVERISRAMDRIGR